MVNIDGYIAEVQEAGERQRREREREYVLNERKLRETIGFNPHGNQAEVLESMERFTCVTAGRRFGKSVLAGYLGMRELWQTEKLVWVAAPTYDLSKRIWHYVHKWTLQEFPTFKINLSELYIENPYTQSRLELKTADNPTSCIGAGVDLLIVDEASRVKGDVWEQALYPTLSDKLGRAFLISTPKGKNWFYKLWMKGQLREDTDYKSFRFETKDNLAIPHLVKEQEDAKRRLSENVYRQEYTAEFLENEGQVFRGVGECIKGNLRSPEYGHRYIIGCDVAKYEDWSVVVVIDLSDFHVVSFDRWQKVDWDWTVKKIEERCQEYCAPIVMDSTGVGDPIAEELERRSNPVHRFVYTNQTKKYIIENLALKIQQGAVSWSPEIKEITHELEVFEYEYSPKSGMVRYNAPAGEHDDTVNALALAVYGAGHYKEEVAKYDPPYPENSYGVLEEEMERKELESGLEHFI